MRTRPPYSARLRTVSGQLQVHCLGCHKWKPPNQFTFVPKENRYQSRCHACCRAYERSHRDKERARRKRYHERQAAALELALLAANQVDLGQCVRCGQPIGNAPHQNLGYNGEVMERAHVCCRIEPGMLIAPLSRSPVRRITG